MMQQEMQQMAAYISAMTGRDVITSAGQTGAAAPSAPRADSGGKSMGSAVTDAAKANMTSYGERLAARAKPDMNAG